MLLLLRAFILHGLVLLSNAVSIKDYPWLVAIYRTQSFKPSEVRCGGSVITNRMVLTSSRCLLHTKFNEIEVKAGADDLADGHGVWYDAEDLITHPEAITSDSLHWMNDIGLIVVIGYFGKDVKPIPLTVAPTDRAMQIQLQGYGTLYPEYNDNRTKLITRTLFIRPDRVCEEQSAKVYAIQQRLESHQRCTIDPNRNYDHCVMTVGGPVTICGLLVGVVSWGLDCRQRGAVILFTDVSSFNEWIYDVTKSLGIG